MKFKTSSTFPTAAIRILALAKDTDDFSGIPGIAAFPGIKTAWEQIPTQKYRTLFGTGGEVAYLIKIDPTGAVGSFAGIARKLSHRERERMTADCGLYWSMGDNSSDASLADFLHGLFLGTYTQGRWQEEAPHHPLRSAAATLSWVGDERSNWSATANRSYVLTDTQLRCMDLVNAPANKKRPQDLAAWAQESAKTYGYSSTVYDKPQCEEMGLHAFLAVNRGSEDPARFIVQEYRGPGAPEHPVALIGKGVTFDTGGISIKGSTNLHLMKSDMGGAAAVLGTLEVAARLQLPLHLLGLIPATDNSVDALSIKPSDVIQSHSGKSIEIIDTDAEGRLCMCDALSYAVTNYQPTTLIDLATLTGSAVRTFGYECAALFSQNETLRAELQQAGEVAGERCWPLPMWDSFMGSLKSDVADIKNYSGKPITGAIDAAKFLEFFTQGHPRFAHLDIAGVALKAGAFAKDRMATGFGIHLLIEWLMNHAEK
ncbi:MAG: leucyl aminopeptidase family protein [Bacteroidota bacterium]